jgi:hypothetical protein
MFKNIALTGVSGSLLWGYHTAATLTSWRVSRPEHAKEWTLTGTVTKFDPFQARQRPLLFTAPREKGRWCWEVKDLRVNERQLTATLGQPLQ